jgi:DNA-binding NarL/FixJ family response regulator
MSGVRVLVVDGQALVGDALAVRLGVEEDIAVLATAASAHQAVTAAQVLGPDVVVIDVRPGEDAGAELTRMLREAAPSVRIVIIGGEDDPLAVCDCLCEGAHAWVSREAESSSLIEAIRHAMSDEISLPPKLLTAVIRQLQARRADRDEHRSRLAQLTERERLILEYMVSGLDRDAIARRLGVSHNTVRTHAQNCYAKLGVHSSLEAVHVAFRGGMRPPVIASGGRHDLEPALVATSKG